MVNDLRGGAAGLPKSLIANNLCNARDQKNIVALKKHFITMFNHKKTPTLFGGGKVLVPFLFLFKG